MTWPCVTIIITTYNYAHFLEQSLRSALDQTYPNIEVIVMDNASTDGTERLMQSYLAYPQVRYYRHRETMSAVANHNSALGLAQGDYIVYLSADDYLFPNFLRKSYLYLQEDQQCDIIFSSISFMDGDGKIQHSMVLTGEPIAAYRGYRNDFANLLAFSNYISFPSVLAPLALYQQFGGFDEALVAIDFELVVRWAKAGIRFGFFPEPLHAVRIHARQETRPDNFVTNGRAIEDFLSILQRHLPPEQEVRLQGYEENVIRTLEAKVAHAYHLGAKFMAPLQERITTTAQTLKAIAQRNYVRTVHPKIGILIFAVDDIPQMLSALHMILDQDYPNWEAIVIGQPGMRSTSLCESFDPSHRRIHSAQLTVPATPGKAVNHALILSSSTCLTFLHAGVTTYPCGHLGAIAEAMGDPRCSITIADSQLRDPSSIMTAPIYHFDAIALKRHTIDAHYYFNEQYPIWTEWDMLMRLSGHYPLTTIDSSLLQRSTVPEALLLSSADRCALAQSLYDAHPSPDHTIQHMRTQYLAQLAALDPSSTNDASLSYAHTIGQP